MRKHHVTTFGAVRSSITIIITVLCLTPLGYTQDNGVDSPELRSLRQNYEAEIVKATENIRANYITQLDGLQKSLGAKDNLDAALAVRKEKEKVSQIPTPVQLAQLRATSDLEIIKATYGSDLKKVDVTQGVKDLLLKEASGKLLLPVAFREDPDFGVTKQLIVTYKYKGKEYKAAVSERNYLVLPDGNTGQVMGK